MKNRIISAVLVPILILSLCLGGCATEKEVVTELEPMEQE